jgi:putative (di)nucleoside polyphosphate hydrolase
VSPQDLSLYRPNVGVVLFNASGLVWLGRRLGARGPLNWQFPQGGVDEGEDWDTAALRELYEETGARSVAKLGETQDWIVYDFPPEARGKKIGQGWRGQKQKWMAFRFTGEDSEFDLTIHPPQEFDAWRWAPLEEAPEKVVPFKRAAYLQVVAAFRAFAG